MLIQEPRFFDVSKFSNTHYLVMMELKKYFANNLFRGNQTRVIYASEQYAFRQRLNLLSKNNVNSVEALDMPFMSYFRSNNWELDQRPGNPNAMAAMVGNPDDGISGQHLRYLPMVSTFDCTCYYANDIDAQLAYETLLFIQYPSEKQYSVDGMEYKGSRLEIPIGLNVSDIQFNPNYTEDNWLRENRIIPIKFRTKIRSVVFSQQPQGPESTEFQEDTLPVLTKKVLLDFLSYHGTDDRYSEENIELVVEGILNPTYAINGTIAVTGVTTSSLTVEWTYDELVADKYQDTVVVYLTNGLQVIVPIEQKAYTFTNLENNSTYTANIVFTSLDNKISKYAVTSTTSAEGIIKLKGMRGNG